MFVLMLVCINVHVQVWAGCKCSCVYVSMHACIYLIIIIIFFNDFIDNSQGNKHTKHPDSTEICYLCLAHLKIPWMWFPALMVLVVIR